MSEWKCGPGRNPLNFGMDPCIILGIMQGSRAVGVQCVLFSAALVNVILLDYHSI